jgi:zinc protease
LYKTLVEDKKLTDNINLYQYNSEIAGQYMLGVTAFDKTDLNRVMEGIEIALKILKQTNFTKDLDRIKGQETSFYQGLASVNGKVSACSIRDICWNT